MVLTARQLALTGLELRDQGIASVSQHSQDWLELARLTAEAMCHLLGRVDSDILHAEMDEQPPHPNAWGAVFHDKRFAWDGWYIKSKRPEAHARMIRVWRLR